MDTWRVLAGQPTGLNQEMNGSALGHKWRFYKLSINLNMLSKRTIILAAQLFYCTIQCLPNGHCQLPNGQRFVVKFANARAVRRRPVEFIAERGLSYLSQMRI